MADNNQQANEVDEVRVVRVGKEIFQEVQRIQFSSDCVT